MQEQGQGQGVILLVSQRKGGQSHSLWCGCSGVVCKGKGKGKG